ncbi:hypothetical protein AKJ38_03640 [candidate division MSBL1 archaeon SCGC-AAA259I14]|uniref:Uncharacterized protein n=2 Tax=candidate division MSBL1 TaxID=215777 RepID=A0A133UPR3_9EURY|nr:hypothetical protein AKJ66_01420 [candidate division MSBL1 archaeon SCGC-AAA259E22]KXA96232.1 hypothetical protein AKJ38_03640 [candidate division MSBL1 archaeon SCGC-AAA259I14]
MYTPNLTPSEINHIKTSLERCDPQGLANELGRAKVTVKSKIRELQESKRIEKMCQYAREKKVHQKSKLKRFKHKAKRRIKGGM